MERRFACLSTVAFSVSFSRLISSKVFSPEPRPAGMLLIDVTLAVVCPRDRGRRDEDGEGENECLEHDPGLEHAGDDRDAVCFECGEGCEEGEVHRLDGVLVAGWYTGILESLVYLHSSCASSM